MSAIKEPIQIEAILKSLKECQSNHSVTNCDSCPSVANCTQKQEFEQQVLDNLTQEQNTLKDCQNKKGFESCLKCTELLECTLRNNYVKAVYLSMNKGNGGSFEF